MRAADKVEADTAEEDTPAQAADMLVPAEALLPGAVPLISACPRPRVSPRLEASVPVQHSLQEGLISAEHTALMRLLRYKGLRMLRRPSQQTFVPIS